MIRSSGTRCSSKLFTASSARSRAVNTPMAVSMRGSCSSADFVGRVQKRGQKVMTLGYGKKRAPKRIGRPVRSWTELRTNTQTKDGKDQVQQAAGWPSPIENSASLRLVVEQFKRNVAEVMNRSGWLNYQEHRLSLCHRRIDGAC